MVRPDILRWLETLPEVQDWMRKEGITRFGQKPASWQDDPDLDDAVPAESYNENLTSQP